MPLASKLPDSDLDGTRTHLADLVKNPTETRVVVALVDVQKITHKVTEGEDIPTLRVRAIEMLDDTDGARATDMLRKAYQLRTGKAELELDWTFTS